jgi:hypothetical protein
MLVHSCNLSTWEAEEAKAGLLVPGHPGQYSETLSQKKKVKGKQS